VFVTLAIEIEKSGQLAGEQVPHVPLDKLSDIIAAGFRQ